MSYTLKELKQQAVRLMLTKVKPAPLLVALVFAALSTAISFFMNDINGTTVIVNEDRMAELSAQAHAGNMPSFAEFSDALEVQTPKVTTFSSILNIALQALSVILGAGFSLYALRFVRKAESAELGNLLDGFGQIYRVTMVYFLRSILVGMGLICLIVPGILLFYSYRQAEYLLWDHPDWSAAQCLQGSRLMMNGRRGKLFLLDLSFLILLYLNTLPLTFANHCFQQAMYAPMIAAILVGCVFAAFVYLYMELSYSLWYNQCLGMIQKENESEEISE